MSKDYGGMMVSFDHAIKWARDQPGSTVKECVLRRLEYERDKQVPAKPKYHKGVHGKKYDTWTCGNCGAGLPEAHWRWCPNCGFAVDRS